MKYKVIPALILIGLCLGLAGCGGKEGRPEKGQGMGKGNVDLMEGIETGQETPAKGSGGKTTNMSAFSQDTADFAVALLQEDIKGRENTNVMVSPVSVLNALAMTANGAKEETLSQMLSVIGKGQEQETLNENVKAWAEGLADYEGAKVKIANAVWFQDKEDRILVEQGFLEKNAEYYHAGVYKAPFDRATLEDINDWVREHTDGQIGKILDKIPQEAVMYLVNAVTFEAQWEEVYEERQIWEERFISAKGEEITTDFMHSEESIYLEDGKASGFMKPYQEGYHFVALLPKEGVSLTEYVGELTGEHFRTLVSEAEQNVTVHVGMPKFESEYGTELKDTLTAMGMADAFDEEKANFSGIGTSKDGNLYMSRVLHKTYICVDGLGTKAGAAATVEIAAELSALQEETYYVTLNRPFLYAVVEGETGIPLFIGIINTLQE